MKFLLIAAGALALDTAYICLWDIYNTDKNWGKGSSYYMKSFDTDNKTMLTFSYEV